jgi:hypothetical protein
MSVMKAAGIESRKIPATARLVRPGALASRYEPAYRAASSIASTHARVAASTESKSPGVIGQIPKQEERCRRNGVGHRELGHLIVERVHAYSRNNADDEAGVVHAHHHRRFGRDHAQRQSCAPGEAEVGAAIAGPEPDMGKPRGRRRVTNPR